MKKAERQQVWDKSKGVCWYCGCKLPSRWHADHFEPILRGCGSFNHETGTRPDLHPERDNMANMVPSCPPCNLFKATYDVEFWRSELEAQVERLRGKSAGFKAMERFGVVAISDAPIRFWFEDNISKPLES